MTDHRSCSPTFRYGSHAIGFAVCVLIAGLTWRITYLPFREHRVALENSVAEHHRVIAGADRLREKHAEVVDDHEAETERYETLTHCLRRIDDAGEFLPELKALAAEERVAIHEFRPDSARMIQWVTRTDLQVHLEGPYSGVCRFLLRLEQLPRTIRIVNCQMTARPQGPRSSAGDEQRIAGQLSLELYALPVAKPDTRRHLIANVLTPQQRN